MTKLIVDINQIHNYYMTKNDEIKEQRAYDSYMDRLPEEIHEFLISFLKFIMFSHMVSDTTKIYFRGNGRTRESIFKRYNYEHPDKPINLNTAKSKINYDKNKLLSYFDDDMIHELITKPDTCDLGKYKRCLTRADARFGKLETLEDRITLKVRCSDYTNKVDQEKFDTFLMLIAPYRMDLVKAREKLIQEQYRDVLSYINFICGGNKMSDLDMENLGTLLELLSCNELKRVKEECDDI